jgi:hypothetical protein
MRLDMVEIGSILERRVVPVEVLHPTMNERVSVTYGTVVTFEVAMIDRVETDNRCIQPDVGLS